VSIRGQDFVAGASVTFGGAPATNVVVVNASTITAVTPSHAEGAVGVVVTNPDGQSSVLIAGFTFFGPPAGTLRGTVFVSSGKPIFFATVAAQPKGGSTLTGADGSYKLELVAGTYTVTGSASGYSSVSQTVTIGSGETKVIDLTLASSLFASSGLTGVGLLRFISDVLQVAVSAILEILSSGAHLVWEALLASVDIVKAAKTSEELQEPAHWAAFFDEVYLKIGKPQAMARIDDCVLQVFGATTWAKLNGQQKLDEELQFCLINSKGYPSGVIGPGFMRQWLQ
jgi:hypothetical protein